MESKASASEGVSAAAGSSGELSATHGLTRRWAMSLLLLALLALVDYRLLDTAIHRVRAEVTAADVAARQAILLQRTIFLSRMADDRRLPTRRGQAVRAELEASLEELSRNHETLTAPTARAEIADYAPELRDAYFAAPFELDRRVRSFVGQLRSVLAGGPASAIDADEASGILGKLESVARMHAAAVDRTVTGLARLDVTLLAANLTVLVLAAAFVFHPMVTRVRQHVLRLARMNDELRLRGRDLEHARGEALRNASDAEQARQAAERSRVELTEHNRELETMLYVISHDLREPLRAIEQFSQTVADRYRDKLDAKGADLLGRTVRAASRMRTLLDDLLELSRARRLRPPDEGVDGGEIVADVVEHLSSRIDETRAKVHVGRDLPRVRADRVWAEQALYNLVGNALKFTRDGEPPEIEIDGYRDERAGAAGFVVRDRGLGVAPEHTQRIFRLFQRAVGREVEGTGAGLAIVAAVAERHGGCAWARPREGGGSEFFITFGDAGYETRGVAA